MTHVRVAALVLVVLATSSQSVCAAPVPVSPEALERAVIELEELAQRGDWRDYYTQAAEIARELHILQQQWMDKVQEIALAQLGNVLAKEPVSGSAAFDVREADMRAIEQLVRVLLYRDNVTSEQRHRKVTLLANVLGRIRGDLIPDYTPKPVVMNVTPPHSYRGVSFSGMNPDAIEDPVAREAYKAAILENRQNNLTNIRQGGLSRLNRALSRLVIGYFVEIGDAHPETRAVILANAVEARLTSDELARVAGTR